MKPEDKVCTLDQAKRLVELGVVLDSGFWWMVWCKEDKTPPFVSYLPKRKKLDFSNGFYFYPAPDVAELGRLLPQYIKTGINEHGGIKIPDMYFVKFSHGERVFFCNYGKIAGNNSICEFDGTTEAQVRCAALIWLIENGYLKAEDIKL